MKDSVYPVGYTKNMYVGEGDFPLSYIYYRKKFEKN